MSKFWNFDRSMFDSLFSSKKPSLPLRSNKVCGVPSLLLKINFSCQFVTKQAKLVDLKWHNFRAIFTLWNILTILEYMWGLWRILKWPRPTQCYCASSVRVLFSIQHWRWALRRQYHSVLNWSLNAVISYHHYHHTMTSEQLEKWSKW